MTYGLAKRLSDAGFPQDFAEGSRYWEGPEPRTGRIEPFDGVVTDYDTQIGMATGVTYKVPSLSELIEACGGDFENLTAIGIVDQRGLAGMPWACNYYSHPSTGEVDFDGKGDTAEEAVANLWLALNPTPVPSTQDIAS